MLAAPEVMKKWSKITNPNLWNEPQNLEPALLTETITWYCRLQPPQRGTSWPLKRSSDAKSWEWCALQKGGSRGIYLILMAISWVAECDGLDTEEYKLLIADVNWVLGILIDITTPNPPVIGKRKVTAEKGSKAAKKQKVK